MKYIKIILGLFGLIIILLSEDKKQQAKKRFITGENDGLFGLLLLYGLRLYWSNISLSKLNQERIELWNSDFALQWHDKKDNNSEEINFFINTFKLFTIEIPSNIKTFIEIGAGNGKNIVAVKNNFSNLFTTFVGVDFQIKTNNVFEVVRGGVMDSLKHINQNSLVLTAGTAMYFSDEELNSLYKTIKREGAMLFLLEPTYNDDFSFFRINPIVSNYDYYHKGEMYNLECIKREKISEDKYMKVYGYLFRSKNDTI